MTIRSERAALRPTGPGDLDLLESWFGDPEFVEHWGGEPLSRTEIAAKYLGARRPAVESFVVEVEGRPVGYAQVWQGTEAQGGIDLVLRPDDRGRGLGPEIARALSDHLLRDRRWRVVTVDPEAENERAIAAWGRAGFEAVGREGSRVIMARERS